MTKLTTDQKKQIISLIDEKKKQLKTYGAVAVFCGVSDAVINLIRQDKYIAKGDDAWLKIGSALGWKASASASGRDWVTYETRDIKTIMHVAADAKNNSLFLGIADMGGIGKSEGLKYVLNKYFQQEVYYMRCMDWGKTEFLENLCKTLGIQVTGIRKPSALLDMIIGFFQQRSLNKPLLFLDEFNKLKDSARLTVIPLYNECEDSLGMVLAGPEDLERSIEKGARHQKKGYDEMYSRIGRTFIKLHGCTLNDVVNICKANGYHDTDRIKEKFEKHNPVSKLINIDGRDVRTRVIRDLRWVKIMVKVNRYKSQHN